MADDYTHMKRAAPKPSAMADLNSEPEEYPYGLRLHLDEQDLKKLGLEMPAVGETVHVMAMCCVRSVHASDHADGGKNAGVELQITHMKAELEDDEDIGEEDTRTPAEKIYGRK